MAIGNLSPTRLVVQDLTRRSLERLRFMRQAVLQHEHWFHNGAEQTRVNVTLDQLQVTCAGHGTATVIADVSRTDVETHGAAALAPAIRDRLARISDTIVILPKEAALRQVVHFPAAATKDLRDIVRHEIDRQSPIDPARIYFDYWVKQRSKAAATIDVELRMIQRESIEQAIGLCRMLGLEPISVGVEGDLPLSRSSLACNRSAVVRAMWRRWLWPALSVAVFILFIATLTAGLARSELVASELQVRIVDARAKAQAVSTLRNTIEELQKRSSFLAEEKQKPFLVGVLAELARTLPDGTWIYSFQLNGREARVHGFSTAASALIGIFDKSSLFINAQFRAPLTQAQQAGIDRFDLSFEIKEGKS